MIRFKPIGFRIVLVWMPIQAYAAGLPDETRQTIESEESFSRTTLCTRGGLPMEVQFSLPTNPSKVVGKHLEFSGIDLVARDVDGKVASLLREAMQAAWAKAASFRQEEWSLSFVRELDLSLAIEIADRAPRALGIEFCGTQRDVGSAVIASLSEYFFRSVQLDNGGSPEWAERLPNPSKAGAIVFLTVSLRLSKISFDPDVVARALSLP